MPFYGKTINDLGGGRKSRKKINFERHSCWTASHPRPNITERSWGAVSANCAETVDWLLKNHTEGVPGKK